MSDEYYPTICTWQDCPTRTIRKSENVPALLKCSRCRQIQYCSKECRSSGFTSLTAMHFLTSLRTTEKLDWKRHKPLCVPMLSGDEEDPHTAITREFAHFIRANCNEGELVPAARSALRIGQPDDLRGENLLRLQYQYVGPAVQSTNVLRSDIPVLRTHFRLINATVERFTPVLEELSKVKGLLDQVSEIRNQISNVKPEDRITQRYIMYVSVAMGDTDKPISSFFMSPPLNNAIFNVFDESSPILTDSGTFLSTLPVNTDWLDRMRRSYTQTVDLDRDTNFTRYLKLVGMECGFTEEESRQIAYRNWDRMQTAIRNGTVTMLQ